MEFVLEGDVGDVILRSLRFEDTDGLYGCIDRNRSHLSPWLSWAASSTLATVRSFVKHSIWSDLHGKSYSYTIRTGCEIIGAITLIKCENLSWEIGYWLTEQYCGRGIVTQAVKCLIDRVQSHGLAGFIMIIDPENIASARVAEKVGATLTDQRYDPRSKKICDVWTVTRQ